PKLEDAALPVETPLHGIINGDDVVRNLRHAHRGVVERIEENLLVELPGALKRLAEHPHPLPRVLDIAGHLERGELRLLALAIIEGLEIQRENFALFPAVLRLN